MVSGESAAREKKDIFWGMPSSKTSKSEGLRSVIQAPLLSRTVKGTLTRLTSTRIWARRAGVKRNERRSILTFNTNKLLLWLQKFFAGDS